MRGSKRQKEDEAERTIAIVPEYPDERIGNFARGLVLGALVGGVAALLNAHRSGAETRARLRGWAEGLRTGAADLAGAVRTAVQDARAWADSEEEVAWTQPVAGAETLTLAGADGRTAEPASGSTPGSALSEVAEQTEATPPTNVTHPGQLTPPGPAGPMPEEPLPPRAEAPTTQLPRGPEA